MKNKIIIILLSFIIAFGNLSYSFSADYFNFDATEIDILDDGNKITANKGGKVTTSDGLIIIANNFSLDRNNNILQAFGNVEVFDTINNYKIFSDDITYFKFSEKIVSKNETKFEIDSRYFINSKNIFFDRIKNQIVSKEKASIKDVINFNYYEIKNFNLDLNDEKLKGNNILFVSKYNEEFNDRAYFESGMFELKNNKFFAKESKILIKKDVFGETENDPRLYGKSIIGTDKILKLNKASFTSCKKSDNCTPWHIEADEIIHNKNKKQITYNNAKLKIFNFPVLYFPKFFHPDPSVDRQSGILKPEINNSNVLGSSASIPYYHVISKDKDLTFKTTIFDNDMLMLQNEFRQSNIDSALILDLGYVNGYKSSQTSTKNSISHFFGKYQSDLNLENFEESELNLNLEKISNDTYLKVFESNISKNKITPQDSNVLNSKIELKLKNDSMTLTSGIKSFENLQLSQNDRYQYILPYYNYDSNIYSNPQLGFLNFSSSGSNELNETNNLKSKIINDINFNSKDYFTESGFKNNLNILAKNLNTVGKKDSIYKSSPQVELMSLFELSSTFPLVEYKENAINYITPKISMRLNPGDMKNYKNADKNIDVNSIFNLNRLGIDDSYEKGKSLSLGVEYKKENLKDINSFFEAKLATVIRDKKEDFIPSKSSLGEKRSNIFGSVNYEHNEMIDFDYNYALDKNLDKFLYNSAGLKLNFNLFETKFSYIEKNGSFGNSNTLENSSKLKLDNNNYITFNTRRNREINLTEYYNLIYEYQNDCLVAGIKYSKNYYQDRDLKPTENLLFTISLFPLTSFEQKIDQ